ncbi:hypothetical protein TIFTF001_039763 [Ficus carica]|uniref:Uncharacterized protein n=1 Tax=Ficus carica TaxID=3494 RepID=A0AA87Z798_FICCA|nr:hypothetical protein TIFTF001_039763 [Ficus carica]
MIRKRKSNCCLLFVGSLGQAGGLSPAQSAEPLLQQRGERSFTSRATLQATVEISVLRLRLHLLRRDLHHLWHRRAIAISTSKMTSCDGRIERKSQSRFRFPLISWSSAPRARRRLRRWPPLRRRCGHSSPTSLLHLQAVGINLPVLSPPRHKEAAAAITGTMRRRSLVSSDGVALCKTKIGRHREPQPAMTVTVAEEKMIGGSPDSDLGARLPPQIIGAATSSSVIGAS